MGGSGTGPILLSQATFLLAHIADSGPVPLSAPAFRSLDVLARRRRPARDAHRVDGRMRLPQGEIHRRPVRGRPPSARARPPIGVVGGGGEPIPADPSP